MHPGQALSERRIKPMHTSLQLQTLPLGLFTGIFVKASTHLLKSAVYGQYSVVNADFRFKLLWLTRGQPHFLHTSLVTFIYRHTFRDAYNATNADLASARVSTLLR